MHQDPLDGLGTPAVATTPAAGTADPLAGLGVSAPQVGAGDNHPGMLSRTWEGAKDFGKETLAPFQPPTTPTEEVLHAFGGPGGLIAYRAAKGLVESAEHVVKSTPQQYQQAVSDYKRALNEFQNKDYRNAIPSAIEAGTGMAGAVNPGLRGGAQDVRELAEGSRPGGDLARPLTRQALEAGTIVAPIVGEEMLGARGATAATTQGASSLRINPFRQILQGKGVAQAPAEAAVREGVQESTVAAGTSGPAVAQRIATAPLLENEQTILDSPLRRLQADEQTAYQRIDKAAGFDLKALKDQLANDQYSIKQLGNTPADLAQQKTLQQSIKDAQTRIGAAEQRLRAGNVDPDAGDVLHKTRMAGQDFKNVLVKAVAPDGTINVDQLLKSSKNLRFAKRGDRIAQFMGNDAADQYISDLAAAQKAGVHAMKVQRIAKWLTGLVAAGAGLAVGGHAVGHLLAE